ncbi:MAG: CPBP family intramembrane metalloprotease [Oscillospiraceae bacterium]|nr:CPBP family intramembrane metalloprotease [Oscillospiraceae bacterium]
MYCANCGKSTRPDFRHCPGCGAALPEPAFFLNWYDQGPPVPPAAPGVRTAPARSSAPPVGRAEDPRFLSMRRAYHSGALAVLVVFGFAFVFQWLVVAVTALLPLFGGGNPLDREGPVAGLAYALIYTVSLALGLLLSLPLWRQVKPVPPARRRLGPETLALAVLGSFGIWGAGALLGIWPHFLAPADLSSPLDNSIPMLLATFLVAPAVEELVFRKLLLDRVRVFGTRCAVVFSGLAFAMAHMNATQFCFAFPMGLLFALVYLRSGNVLLTMGLHCMVNFFVVLDQLGGMIFDDWFDILWLSSAALLTLAGLVVLFMSRRNPLFSTEPNRLPWANRAAFHGWGFILCEVLAILGILADAAMTARAAEGNLALLHFVPALGAVAAIIILGAIAPGRAAPAPVLQTVPLLSVGKTVVDLGDSA